MRRALVTMTIALAMAGCVHAADEGASMRNLLDNGAFETLR